MVPHFLPLWKQFFGINFLDILEMSVAMIKNVLICNDENNVYSKILL